MHNKIADVVKRENERPEIIVRRFSRIIQENALPKIVKESKVLQKAPNRHKRRLIAIKQSKIRQSKRGWSSY